MRNKTEMDHFLLIATFTHYLCVCVFVHYIQYILKRGDSNTNNTEKDQRRRETSVLRGVVNLNKTDDFVYQKKLSQNGLFSHTIASYTLLLLQ